MQFVPSINLIKKADKEGYAVPSFTVWNAETIKVVLETAEEMRSPVILLTGPSELMLFKPRVMAEIARVIANDYTVPAALHLDHANSLDLVKECIDAKYTSVMLDFSSKPYEENVNALKKVVSLAKPLGITVEGEIGSIGRAEKYSVENRSGLTDPKEAKKYAKETGVDMLAVSIGNAHGIYNILPKFDFPRLKEIHELTKIPLVLHGGSGTPVEDVKQSIALGIRKINVASELVQAFRERLMKMWTNGEKLWMSVAFFEGLKVLPEILKKWIRNLGSEGKAD
jgi:ketose-bisphosphate aldolase